MTPSISAADVLHIACGGGVSLNAELVGFTVLSAAEQCRERPRRVLAESLCIDSEGQVSVDDAAFSESPESAEALRLLLRRLLAQAQASGPALMAVAGEPSPTLGEWRSRLEAALIPLNRSASKRALARLFREVSRHLAESPRDPEACSGPDVQADAEPTSEPWAVAPPPVPAEPWSVPQPLRRVERSQRVEIHPSLPGRASVTPAMGSPAPGRVASTSPRDFADDRLTPPLGTVADFFKGSLTPVTHLPSVQARPGTPSSCHGRNATSTDASAAGRVVELRAIATRGERPKLSSVPQAEPRQALHRDSSDFSLDAREDAPPPRPVRKSDVRALVDGFDVGRQLGDKELARTLRSFAGLNGEGLTLTPPPVGTKHRS